MAEYQQIRDSDAVLRRADNAYIPPDPANSDRQRYSEWLAEGNTPDPPDTLPPVTMIPSFDFLSRFTRDEQLEMQNACATDATLGAGLTNLTSAASVDLQGSAVSNWLDGLVAAKVIAAERKAELLAPVLPAHETAFLTGTLRTEMRLAVERANNPPSVETD